MTSQTMQKINGLDVEYIQQTIEAFTADPDKAQTRWHVTTDWIGGALSRSRVRGYHIGGQWVPRNFTLTVDEPHALAGTDTHPNPQEYLLTALNACMMMGYVAVASLLGVELESVQIETEGNIDLRGFLGIDPAVKPGYDELRYTVRIKGNGTEEQFQKIHEIVMATSPNRFNVSQPIRLKADLVIQ